MPFQKVIPFFTLAAIFWYETILRYDFYFGYLYSWYWTGTSLKSIEANVENLFKCKSHEALFNNIPLHYPPLHASSSLSNTKNKNMVYTKGCNPFRQSNKYANDYTPHKAQTTSACSNRKRGNLGKVCFK